MASLVHGCADGMGFQYRVIASGDLRFVERREQDALGDPRWVQIGAAINVRSAPSPALEPASFAIRTALLLLDDVVKQRDALAKTYDYSTGKGT